MSRHMDRDGEGVVRANVDELLSLDHFSVDEGNSHVKVDLGKCAQCEGMPCLYVCPARCYRKNDGGEIRFDYAGCLECGTCRVACQQLGAGGVTSWAYPRSTFGVSFRYA